MKTTNRTNNFDLILQAKDALDGKWGVSVLAFLVVMLILGGVPRAFTTYYSGDILIAILGGAFQLGMAIFALRIVRKKEVRFVQIFDGFKNFFKAFGVYLLFAVLLSLLPSIFFGAVYYHQILTDFTAANSILLVGGFLVWLIVLVVFSCMYAMVFYILADNPEMGVIEVFTKSRKMMNGYKLKCFGMMLWFILFILAGALTLGIAYLFLIPLMNVAVAKFYEEVKANSEGEVEFVEIL